ncbi:MAG: T9SS type A sorting domain-containing protein [Saprospiraceae bacterium]|nr:T9SS type A sorting domain-containing protein [Saprospiraceae bacterium]
MVLVELFNYFKNLKNNPKSTFSIFLLLVSLVCNITTNYGQAPLGGGKGSVLASTLDGKIWSINLDNGLAIMITQSPYFSDGINSLAIDTVNSLIYYVSEKGVNRNLFAYDYNNDTHFQVLGLDIQTTNSTGIGQGAAHVYNGSIYLGVENVIPSPDGVSDNVYKVDLLAGSMGRKVSASTLAFYKNYTDEWGDFVIKDDKFFNNVAHRFEALTLSGSVINSVSKSYFGQMALNYTNKVYNVNSTVQEIDADPSSTNFGNLIGSSFTITLDMTNQWNVPIASYDSGKDASDATGPTPSKNSLGDLIFYDVNANGARDAGEPGISGVNVDLWLDVNNDGVINAASGDVFISSTRTNNDGLYKFETIQPGNFIVKVTNIEEIVENSTLTYGVNPKPMNVNKLNKFFDTADFGYSGRYAILPVVFDFVKITEVDCKALIQWQTTAEQNCKFYEILRSDDNINYSPLSYLPAKLNEQANTYEFIDNHPNAISYYKIKEVDFDGKSITTDVFPLHVYCDGEADILDVFPNPTTDHVNVQYISVNDGGAQVYILDELNNLVRTLDFSVKKGTNIKEVTVNDLSAGAYFIQILQNGQRSKLQKFIIQK